MKSRFVDASAFVATVVAAAVVASPIAGQEGVPEAGVAAAGQILSVRMTAMPSDQQGSADDFPDARYDVSITYDATFSGEPVELHALGLDGVSLQAMSVLVNGTPTANVQWDRVNPTGGATQAWRAVLPPQPEGVQGTVEVQYEVAGAYQPTGQLTLPVLMVGLDPPAALPGAFVAEVRLPAGEGAGTHVRRAFPTDVRGGTGPADSIVTASLPVVPRTLRFQLGAGEATRWARTSLLELLATVLIVGFGLMGWRHLVRSV